MAEITIDGEKFDTEKMSEQAQAQVRSLQFVESEIIRNANERAVLKTAKLAYAKALKDELSAKN